MSLTPPVSGTLPPRVSGRLAGWLFIGSGALTILYLFLPAPPMINRLAVEMAASGAILVGCAALLLPWDRWSPRATLALLLVGFAIISIGNVYGSIDSSMFGVFFIVAFMWTGVAHPRGTSLWFAPIATVAYVVPIFFRPPGTADAASAAIVIPIGVLVGEMLAWLGMREERSRESARTLARVTKAVASNLDKESVLQTLVHETRAALQAEHAMLIEVDSDSVTIRGLYASGVAAPFVKRFNTIPPGAYGSLESVRRLFNATAPIVVADTRSDHGFPSEFIEPFRVKSFISVPVVVEDKIVGLLTCAETSRRRSYTAHEISLFGALAGEAEIAMRNALHYERALEAARRDPLTGLSNRRAFHERLAAEVELARRHERNVSLVVLDIDRFKLTNDTWGHLAGDRALQRFAAFLAGLLRGEDDVYRLGGDEFALILPDTPCQGAVAMADRLRRNVERARLGNGDGLRFTVSAGVASFPDHATEPDELVERADSALYEVKLAGDAVAISPNGSRGQPGYPVELDVRKIIEGRLLQSVYQPIIALDSGRAIGYEAFCRLEPALGDTPIRTLFRAAGRLGLDARLDRVCRDVALSGATDLPEGALFFLNVSPATLGEPDFAAEAAEAVSRAGIDPQRTVLEISEDERSPEFPELVHKLDSCWRHGLHVAIDDVGVGGADLELLANFAFEYAKIDMSFIQHASNEDSRRRVLAGLRGLVSETGAEAIAEGVETQEDLRLVRGLGFDGAQGFLLGRPEPTFRSLDLAGLTLPS